MTKNGNPVPNPMNELAYISVILMIHYGVRFFLADRASIKNSNMGRIISIAVVIIILMIQVFTAISISTAHCGQAQVSKSLLYVFIPNMMYMAVIVGLLFFFPGFKEPFSNTFGYLAILPWARSAVNDLLISGSDKSEGLLKQLYSDESVLINLLTPSEAGFTKRLENLTNSSKKLSQNWKGTKAEKLLYNLVVVKDKVGEFIWIFLGLAITLSTTFNSITSIEDCVKSDALGEAWDGAAKKLGMEEEMRYNRTDHQKYGDGDDADAAMYGNASEREPIPDAPATWAAGPWGKCNATSSTTGTQSRSVTCDDSFCSGSKPPTERRCDDMIKAKARKDREIAAYEAGDSAVTAIAAEGPIGDSAEEKARKAKLNRERIARRNENQAIQNKAKQDQADIDADWDRKRQLYKNQNAKAAKKNAEIRAGNAARAAKHKRAIADRNASNKLIYERNVFAKAETLNGSKGKDYRGKQTKTTGGHTCQRWDKSSPQHRNPTFYNQSNANSTGTGGHNYCRNPDGENTIWCYTTSPNKRWGYCNPLKLDQKEVKAGRSGVPAGYLNDQGYFINPTGKNKKGRWDKKSEAVHDYVDKNRKDSYYNELAHWYYKQYHEGQKKKQY